VFGSYARGEARPDSDLDLAFDFIDADEALSEMIERAAAWKAELSQLTGIMIKDVYLTTDKVKNLGPTLLRSPNGFQVDRVVALAMRNKPSVDFCGYWQRSW
jgi:Nucleotidyltransferase domain